MPWYGFRIVANNIKATVVINVWNEEKTSFSSGLVEDKTELAIDVKDLDGVPQPLVDSFEKVPLV